MLYYYKKFMERLGENYKEQLDYVIIRRVVLYK